MRTGFSVHRVSDQTYLLLYKFGSSTPFLTSRAFLEDFDGRNYGVVNSYAFQSLQFGVTDDTQPIVLPSIEYTWAGAPLDWGGKFTTTVDTINLFRPTGSDSRRISLGTEMDVPYTTANGQRFNFIAALRGDAYDVSDLQLTSTSRAISESTGRIFPQVGIEWSYPFAKQTANNTYTITPRAAVYAAPVGLNPPGIPDDDSQAVDFSDAQLFTRNRAQGFDLVDSGQRVDYGLQGNWSNKTGQSASFLVGQSYRFQNASPFAVDGLGDGLDRPLSDYVGRLTFAPGGTVDLSYHFRFDQEDLRPQRQEAAVNFGPSDLRVGVSILQLGNNVRDAETERTELAISTTVRFNQYWTASVAATRELAGDGTTYTTYGNISYTDECLTFVTTLDQTGLRDRDVRPSTSLLFQFVFKNIGEIGLPGLQLGNSSL